MYDFLFEMNEKMTIVLIGLSRGLLISLREPNFLQNFRHEDSFLETRSKGPVYIHTEPQKDLESRRKEESLWTKKENYRRKKNRRLRT